MLADRGNLRVTRLDSSRSHSATIQTFIFDTALVGRIITIATMFVRELFWVILKGDWLVNFLIFWFFVVPPAILFMVAWELERKTKQA